MRVLVFATTDPDLPENSGPFVVIPETPEAFLPPHPDGLEWSYFVTTTIADVFLLRRRDEAEAGLAAKGYFVFGKTTGQAAAVPTIGKAEPKAPALERTK